VTFEKFRFALVLALFIPAISGGVTMAQAIQHPRLEPESVGEFAAAYSEHNHRSLDSRHRDTQRYRAYRFVTSGASGAVTARSITVDAAGHLHIIGEPGTRATGKASRGPGVMHVLLPATATLPQ
jgi:hypothetical protein